MDIYMKESYLKIKTLLDDGVFIKEFNKALHGQNYPILTRRSKSNISFNAHYAVEGIKQDKSTPQQCIVMLKKNGGLKARVVVVSQLRLS